MKVTDLVTQVSKPNDKTQHNEDEDDPFGVHKINVNAISTTTGPNKAPLSPRSQNGFCSNFCCGSKDDDADLKVNAPKSQTPTKWVAHKPALHSLPKYDEDRPSFNSPRPGDENGVVPWRDDHLLPPQREGKKGKKCLILDLDETLVHSSFKPVDCDFVVPVEIENQVHQVYVAKRPHVDEFMQKCGELFEVVVFTASLAKYADPVLDLLDKHKVVDWRLFRESCTPFKGSYVKDLGRMGRDINQTLIVDNSPHSYYFNPENAVPCESWFNDTTDQELLEIIPKLEMLADPEVTDVKPKLTELGFFGVEVLRRELAGFYGQEEGDEYTDSQSDSYSQE